MTLRREEFLASLRQLGLFDEPGLPDALTCEERFAELMFPLIDPWGKGLVTVDNLLFLEKDAAKRRRLWRKPAHARRAAAEEAAGNTQAEGPSRPVRSATKPKAQPSALNLLSDLSKLSRRGLDMNEHLRPSAAEIEALAKPPRAVQKRRQRMPPRPSVTAS